MLKIIRDIIIGAVLVLGTLAVMAVAGEKYLRETWKDARVNWPAYAIPNIGYIFTPGEIVSWTNYVDFYANTKANSLGFLDREPLPLEQVQDKVRIAVIGDSFVEAAQLPIENKSHVLLEEMLDDSLGKDAVATYAFGFSGTGQVNQLPYYDYFAKKYDPDIVVLIVVSNDFGNNSCMLEALRNGWDPRHIPRPSAYLNPNGKYTLHPVDMDWSKYLLKKPEMTEADPELQEIYNKYYLYRWLAPALSSKLGLSLAYFSGAPEPKQEYSACYYEQLQKMPELAHYMNKGESFPPLAMIDLDTIYKEKNIPAFFQEGINATAFGLQQWKDRADRDGFKLVALLSYTVEAHHTERMATLLDRFGIPYADQRDYILSLGRAVNEARFKYDGHWNENGHVWAAQAMAKLLRPMVKEIAEKR